MDDMLEFVNDKNQDKQISIHHLDSDASHSSGLETELEELRNSAESCTTMDSAQRADHLTGLCDDFEQRNPRFRGDMAIILELTRIRMEAVRLTPAESPNRNARVYACDATLEAHDALLRQRVHIEQSDGAKRVALSTIPVNTDEYWQTRRELGPYVHWTRSEIRQIDETEASLELKRAAVNLIPEDDVVRAEQLYSLANDLYRHSLWVDSHQILSEALIYLRQAFKITTDDGPNHVEQFDLMTRILESRFERFKRPEELDEAISYKRQAVDATPADDESRVARLKDLGDLICQQLQTLRHPNHNLEEHIKLYESQVDDTICGGSDTAVLLGTLAGLKLLAYQVGSYGGLDDVVQLYQTALQFAPIDEVGPRNIEEDFDEMHHAELLNGLSEAFQERFQHSHDPIDLDEAVALSNSAIRLTKEWNLDFIRYQNRHAHNLITRYQLSGDARDRHEVVSLLRQACLAEAEGGSIQHRLQAASSWANLMHNETKATDVWGDLSSAMEAYSQAIPMISALAAMGNSTTAHLNELSNASDLACNAAACAFRLAELNASTAQTYLEKAIEVLEQGRGVMWSQLAQLQVDLVGLEDINPQLSQRTIELSRILRGGNHRDSASAKWTGEGTVPLRRLGAEWDELVEGIRKLPGYAGFLQPPPFCKLRTALNDIPLVLVNVSKYRCDAVIIHAVGDLHLIRLPNLTPSKVETWAKRLERCTSAVRNRHLQQNNSSRRSFDKIIMSILHELWDTIAGPVLQHLNELWEGKPSDKNCFHRIYWLLTGGLSFLPIHAALPRLPGQNGVMEQVISSYIPTLSILFHAQRKQIDANFKYLATGQCAAPGAAHLPGVVAEMEVLRRLPIQKEDITYLEGNSATVTSVVQAFPTSSWVHFACHATQDIKQPLESAFLLQDGSLSLALLSQLLLPKADFAMLLACESAKGSVSVSNEVVHIAAGLQVVGFRSVIATLWSISDEDGPVVTENVYKYLFRRGMDALPDSREAAFALHRAMLYLRDERKTPVSRWLPYVHFGA